MKTLENTHSLIDIDWYGEVGILIDKPQSWTSFDVVNKIRYRLKSLLKTKKIKVGHAGTLDPMATGLLILCTGKGTKQLFRFQGMDKIYSGSMVFGKSTPSYDKETEPDCEYPHDHISIELITKKIEKFTGVIQQVPPPYSAIKRNGIPLYKLARKGKFLKVNPREIQVYDFKALAYNPPELTFKIVCSKGTYIRSIAHDLGKSLNSGAYLSSLRRTKIGEYCVDDAWQINEFIEQLEASCFT